MLRILLLAVAIAALAAADQSPIGRPFLHGLFTDHMVLQREASCPVWGWTRPGASVTVTMAGMSASAIAGADGAWMARIGPFPPGGPHVLNVSGPQQASLQDVLVGDVWICSGQSNMEFGIKGVTGWWNEIGGDGAPEAVRLATVIKGAAFDPSATLPLQWRSSRSSVGDEAINHGGFSAIGFLFARQLQRETGIPIGIIQSAWGATSIQAWSSPAALQRQCHLADPDVRKFIARTRDEAWRRIDPAYAATREWPTAPVDDWAPIDLPAAWPQADGRPFTGAAWFRTEVEVPAAWRDGELELALGTIQGADDAWCNGVFIGAGESDGQGRQWPRNYRIPAGTCRDGRAVITVRVLGERFLGKAGELGLRAPGAAALPLTGWRCRTSTPMARMTGRPPDPRNTPAGCYQAMIAPLAPFAIKGALWYQGEGNVGDAGTYRRRLTDMVADWRALFGAGDVPFLIVQLAGFGARPAQPAESGWSLVREAQAQVAATVPGCGLAVAIDRGEIYDIHPKDKQDVAKRLALVALARTYGKPVACEGPTFTTMTVEGANVRLRFANATGLKSLGGGPTGFAISGPDRTFTWAQARIEGETVVVSAAGVAEPVAVRYAWGDHPLCNLYNRDDLPMAPFRSDTW